MRPGNAGGAKGYGAEFESLDLTLFAMQTSWLGVGFTPAFFPGDCPMASTSRSKKRRSARVSLIHKPHGMHSPQGSSGRARAFRHRKRRLCQGSLQMDAGRLLRQGPCTPHHGRAHTKGPQGDGAIRYAKPSRSSASGDLTVAIERTGRYHLPVKRAFVQAQFDTRLVHPLTSKQFRQPANPGNKTDDTDLSAIHRCDSQRLRSDRTAG